VSHAEGSDAVTGVDYAGLVGVLVEAIKEQQTQADAQQAEIEGLKAKALQAEAQQAKLEAQQAEIARLRAEMQQQQEAISRLMVQFSLMKGPEMIAQR
jgi:predicted RNase H-like nuclease (RuvC/YqgF family)